MADAVTTAMTVKRVTNKWIEKTNKARRSSGAAGKKDVAEGATEGAAEGAAEIPKVEGAAAMAAVGAAISQKQREAGSSEKTNGPVVGPAEAPSVVGPEEAGGTAAGSGGDGDDDKPSIAGRVLWVLGLPYQGLYRITVPDCRKERFEKWYALTFVMSIFWIGVLSYAMLFFSKKAGCIIGIPQIVMGLVVISAGTSVPDALASIFVAKNGQGDMAVSNVLGSNVFNIFLGLGLPCLIYTAVWWTPYTSMQMQDPLALLEPIIILFVYIFLLLGVMLFSGWRLYPKVGYVLILLDLLFIAWSLLTHPLGGAGSTPVIAVNGR